MAPKQQKQVIAPVDIVDLGSSDDEDTGAFGSNSKPSVASNLQTKQPMALNNVDVSAANRRRLDNHSFWRAGAYETGKNQPSRVQALGELEHARVHPKFLHSNATSHKWAFGAIAELLDNAVDEIGNGATFVNVDRIYNSKDNSPALIFLDDGGGMDPDGMRKCMGLGYSSKTSNKTIGQYGNGFKTSTMRLGADVIVFSRSTRSGQTSQSVGLLSYTFLRRTGQDDVIVPMIDFNISEHRAEPIIYTSMADWSSNLKTILEWSPFVSKDEIMRQFDNMGSHGTKIIIYNLWMNDEGVYELNFDDDNEDIRLRDEVNLPTTAKKPSRKDLELQSHLSNSIRYSLRAYASILYLRKFTNFKIILRGKPVEQYSIKEDLRHSKRVIYTPHVGPSSREAAVETTIGFIKEAPYLGVCGFNVYHKNRLIRPYWKIIPDGSNRGQGVVGVLEANFIEPAHDKQDFERSALYIKLEAKLKQIVGDYWKAHSHLLHQAEGVRKNDVQLKLDSSNNLTTNSSIQENLDAASLDQICEENVQLFMRCEQYKEKHAGLKQKIEQLEKDLEETRSKCAKLSSHLDLQKKQTV
ncbi:protein MICRORCHIDIA 2-like [Andrographis paniculata]|uniref:protein MICRORCHIDIA 2-like n=1 Tax=Andrographis paniculata TaxID=175694 RepID=UPI0021E8A501|nr:protein MICRORCHIDIA 2-like [Andrographis paniculata]